jgi:hypothetical protein
MQEHKPPRRRRQALSLTPIERRLADLWDNSLLALLSIIIEAHADDRPALLKHARTNFIYEGARDYEELLHYLIVATYDKPRPGRT